jgi:hypothetical protein
MCIRPGIMFLSTVILGPYSPSRNINVYLRPLIDELNKLWSFEVLTYNISRKKSFQNEDNFDMDYKLFSSIWNDFEQKHTWKINMFILYEKNKAFTSNGGKVIIFIISIRSYCQVIINTKIS